MKLVMKTAVVLLAGAALVDACRAGVFFQRGAQPVRYRPVATAPPPVAQPAPATVSESGEMIQVVAPGSTMPNQVIETAVPQDDIIPVSDRVVSQYDQEISVDGLSAEARVCKVNSKHLHFSYDLRDVGPSGVMGVDVWYTRDGKAWDRFSRPIPQSGGGVDVIEEGVYGITFVPRTGFGGGKEPPAAGDQPQLWVEVDVTKPEVSLTGLQPGAGSRTLRVDWNARDKNLGKRPVVLYYAEQADGPWTPFTSALENTGTFTWQIPPSTPSTFWLRVAGTDVAGNVGTSESQSPVRIDLSLPTVANVRVSPGAK